MTIGARVILSTGAEGSIGRTFNRKMPVRIAALATLRYAWNIIRQWFARLLRSSRAQPLHEDHDTCCGG